jgi:hypothetical protein
VKAHNYNQPHPEVHVEDPEMFQFSLEEDASQSLLLPSEEAEHASELGDVTDLLQGICAAFAKADGIVFKIEGFGQPSWPVDVSIDLEVFLEQFPGLVTWITDINASTYILDFYEQGLQRRLCFDNKESMVQITCESWGTFQPCPEIERVTTEILSSMTTMFLENFLHLSSPVE